MVALLLFPIRWFIHSHCLNVSSTSALHGVSREYFIGTGCASHSINLIIYCSSYVFVLRLKTRITLWFWLIVRFESVGNYFLLYYSRRKRLNLLLALVRSAANASLLFYLLCRSSATATSAVCTEFTYTNAILNVARTTPLSSARSARSLFARRTALIVW